METLKYCYDFHIQDVVKTKPDMVKTISYGNAKAKKVDNIRCSYQGVLTYDGIGTNTLTFWFDPNGFIGDRYICDVNLDVYWEKQ